MVNRVDIEVGSRRLEGVVKVVNKVAKEVLKVVIWRVLNVKVLEVAVGLRVPNVLKVLLFIVDCVLKVSVVVVCRVLKVVVGLSVLKVLKVLLVVKVG